MKSIIAKESGMHLVFVLGEIITKSKFFFYLFVIPIRPVEKLADMDDFVPSEFSAYSSGSPITSLANFFESVSLSSSKTLFPFLIYILELNPAPTICLNLSVDETSSLILSKVLTSLLYKFFA